MIILERKIPECLPYYEVMMRRSLDPTKYETEYAKANAGYYGECRLDQEWKDANIHGLFFHDFTCINKAGKWHQIDTIYVCKHFVFIIEVKNVTGRIEVNPQTYQLLRYTENREVKAFSSPIEQVKRHRHMLTDYLETIHGHIPIEAAVIITNLDCLIGNTGNDIPIFVVTGLRSKIAELTERYKHINLNLQQIKASLQKLYRPQTQQPWRKKDSIRFGVLCLNCNNRMIPTNNGFKCPRCNLYDSNHLAVRRTLHDFRVIYGPEISNRQFRQFAEIKSPDTAYKILSRLLPERKGIRRNVTYLIPKNIYQPSY